MIEKRKNNVPEGAGLMNHDEGDYKLDLSYNYIYLYSYHDICNKPWKAAELATMMFPRVKSKTLPMPMIMQGT